jgi:ubiquinone/menaquinone biosynthesis C-methylase UbiE
LSSEKSEYDMALSFFSINTLSNRHKFRKLTKELKRILKNRGRLIIWDVYDKGALMNIKLDMKVLVDEGDIRSVNYNILFNPFRPKFSDVINILEKNGFDVASKINGNIYCIEAVNNKEVI